MIDRLVDCCNERLSLGQSYIKQLSDRLASLIESERKCVRYHSECRKHIVNMSMIARLRSKRVRSDSPVCLTRLPGRPMYTTDSARPKRTTSTSKAKVCVFSSCSFCPNDTAGSLHRAFSGGTGERLIEIKLKTQDDHVRTCVSELEGAGYASALEKYYHRTCLRSAQRTFTPVFRCNVQVIRTVCDEQLHPSIQNNLSDGVTLNMGEVNDAYLLFLKRYHAEVDETTNYRNHLKQLNTDPRPFCVPNSVALASLTLQVGTGPFISPHSNHSSRNSTFSKKTFFVALARTWLIWLRFHLVIARRRHTRAFISIG